MDLSELFAGELALGDAPRRELAAAVKVWALARTPLPAADPRVVELLRGIDEFSRVVQVKLDPVDGLKLTGATNQAAQLLSRGSSWIRGGDWSKAALSAVCRA